MKPLMKTNSSASEVFLLKDQILNLINSLSLTSTYGK